MSDPAAPGTNPPGSTPSISELVDPTMVPLPTPSISELVDPTLVPLPVDPGTTPSSYPNPGTTSSGSQGSTPPVGSPNLAPFLPTKPIMGDIIQVGLQIFVAWTGGKPKHDWSMLDSSAYKSPQVASQQRPTFNDKLQHYRSQGLKTKLSRNGKMKMKDFELKVRSHLEKYGLDTIAYIPDPVDSTKMIFTVTNHGRYTLKSVAKLIAPQTLCYDIYDRANDRAATEFLVDSLDFELASTLNDRIKETDPFPMVFLRLIHLTRSTSFDRFGDLKTSIARRKPTQYPGQNIELMATDMKRDARALEIAGQYEHTLTYTMSEAFMEAGGTNNEDFRARLRNTKWKLNEALTYIGFLDKSAADEYMIENKLTYEDICEEAEILYRTQNDRQRWPPSRGHHDSKAPPKAFGNLAMTHQVQFNLLLQQQLGSNGRAKKDDICLHCGQKGHWARDCPQKKQGKSSHSNGHRHSNNKSNGAWKKVPPGDGTPETKTMNGKTWHWCAHCTRWSTTHGTAGHTGPKTNSAPPKHEANLLFANPSAWHAPVPLDAPLIPTLLAVCIILQNYLKDGLLRFLSILPKLIAVSLSSFYIGSTAPHLPFLLWSTLFTTFNGSWYNFAAPILWITLLTIVIVFSTLTPSTPSASLPSSPTKLKQLRRRSLHWRHQSHTPSRRKQARHHGLVTKIAARPPFSDRLAPSVYTAIAALKLFADSLKFQRVPRREGDNWRPTYHPIGNHTHCIPQSHAKFLASPTAYAYFLNAELPSSLTTKIFRAAMTSPAQTNDVLHGKQTRYPVIWDSGASISISHCKDDFVGPLESAPVGLKIRGIAKGLYIQGIGHVAWSFVDATGTLRTLKLKAYHVPAAEARLLSTQSLLQTYTDESIVQQTNHLWLSGSKKKGTNPINVSIDPASNLPVCTAYTEGSQDCIHQEFNSVISTTSDRNMNLNAAERELLRWHHRLGHLGFRQIQFLMRSGALSHSESARRLHMSAAKLQIYPLCSACQYGKQRRKPSPGKRSHVVRDRDGILKKDNLFPGQRVSVDHFVCSTRGRLLHTYGKEDPRLQFVGGAIFVDHASGYIFVAPQVNLNTHETLKAKDSFERHCRDFGVIVAEYLSDNGSVFTSKSYVEHLEKFQQVSRFAGVGAHHMNGIAERSIQTVMSVARTMLLHQAIHWPDIASATIWPLAVLHAVYLYNHMPNPSTGLSPHDLLSKTRWPLSKLADCHVFGCPVYVLDKTISDGKTLPRWKPRSTRMMFVGMSPLHASSVPRCLNPDTGAITAQFHVVFDDSFTTVAADFKDLPDFDSAEWQELFGDSVYQYVFDDDDQRTSDELAISPDVPPPLMERVATQVNTHNPPIPLPVLPPPTSVIPTLQTDPTVEVSLQQRETPFLPLSNHDESPVAQSLPQRENIGAMPNAEASTPPKPPPGPPPLPPPLPSPISPSPPPETPTHSVSAPPPRRISSRRTKGKAPSRLGYDGSGKAGFYAGYNAHFATYLSHSVASPSHAAFKARAVKDPDTLSYNDAMKSADKDKWCEAAKLEITELEEKGTWKEVPMSEAKTKILPGTWVFRIKRKPSGEIKKYKARYCVRGDLEEENDEDTFAPTVAWSTVRLFLVLCLTLGWTTISIDYSNAFVQSKLDTPVWIHLPRGFLSPRGPGTCLRLIKSLYGLSIAPALWSKTCIAGLKKCGFTQSLFDPCLLFKTNMIIVLYVDDAGIGAANPADIDSLIQQLRGLGFELKKEGDFTEFLGIKLDKQENGSINLTQSGLINKILESSDMVDCRPNRLPATGPLGSDPLGPPMSDTWNYRSIVGMLLYLSTNTRCDIAFAVSQVARFSQNPKQSHATAVKTILRYLKRTRDKGMLINITGKLNLDLYVDADFCGLYKTEPDQDPTSARSRSGYIIKLSGCPLTWRSQLQTSITCSTLESEYNALSSALKFLIPLKRILLESVEKLNISSSIKSTVCARAFEDNQGAYFLATNHRITNRTRWYLNRWHWFWSHVDSGFVSIHKIDTTLMDADYFTKALSAEPFEANRIRVQGW